MTARLPLNESGRLAALYCYEILDTEAELAFDEITALAAQIHGTSIAFISLLSARTLFYAMNL